MLSKVYSKKLKLKILIFYLLKKKLKSLNFNFFFFFFFKLSIHSFNFLLKNSFFFKKEFLEFPSNVVNSKKKKIKTKHRNGVKRTRKRTFFFLKKNYFKNFLNLFWKKKILKFKIKRLKKKNMKRKNIFFFYRNKVTKLILKLIKKKSLDNLNIHHLTLDLLRAAAVVKKERYALFNKIFKQFFRIKKKFKKKFFNNFSEFFEINLSYYFSPKKIFIFKSSEKQEYFCLNNSAFYQKKPIFHVRVLDGKEMIEKFLTSEDILEYPYVEFIKDPNTEIDANEFILFNDEASEELNTFSLPDCDLKKDVKNFDASEDSFWNDAENKEETNEDSLEDFYETPQLSNEKTALRLKVLNKKFNFFQKDLFLKKKKKKFNKLYNFFFFKNKKFKLNKVTNNIFFFFNDFFFFKNNFSKNYCVFLDSNASMLSLNKKVRVASKVLKVTKLKRYLIFRKKSFLSFEILPYLKNTTSSMFFKKCTTIFNKIFLREFFRKKKRRKKKMKKNKNNNKLLTFYRRKIKLKKKIYFLKKKKRILEQKCKNVLVQKNFLPIFFLLKKINTFLFLKNIINFFFFFLPISFFKVIFKKFFKKKKISVKNKLIIKHPTENVDFWEITQFYNLKKKNKFSKRRNFFFFNFLTKFFGDKFKERISINILSTRKIEKKFFKFFKFYREKIKFYLNNFFFKFNCFEFLKLFFVCLRLKDLSSLSIYIKMLLERIQIKFHKIFLKKFELFLIYFFYKFKKKVKIKGFYMDIRGKVSVVGNSKKRHLCIKVGIFSRSRKNLKFYFIKNQINTRTGVLGASYLLSY